MAQNQNGNEDRDFLDDLIDIQDSLQVFSNPLDALMGSLSIDPNTDKPFEPMDYKEIPWSNANRCLRCASGKAEACSRCLDICPANCIDIHNQSVTHPTTRLACSAASVLPRPNRDVQHAPPYLTRFI